MKTQGENWGRGVEEKRIEAWSVTCMLMKDGEPWISVFDGGDGKINGEVDGGGVFYFREKAFFFYHAEEGNGNEVVVGYYT